MTTGAVVDTSSNTCAAETMTWQAGLLNLVLVVTVNTREAALYSRVWATYTELDTLQLAGLCTVIKLIDIVLSADAVLTTGEGSIYTGFAVIDASRNKVSLVVYEITLFCLRAAIKRVVCALLAIANTLEPAELTACVQSVTYHARGASFKATVWTFTTVLHAGANRKTCVILEKAIHGFLTTNKVTGDAGLTVWEALQLTCAVEQVVAWHTSSATCTSCIDADLAVGSTS